MIDPTQAGEWVAGGRTWIELLRLGWGLSPKSPGKDANATKLADAERAALDASNAKLGKERTSASASASSRGSRCCGITAGAPLFAGVSRAVGWTRWKNRRAHLRGGGRSRERVQDQTLGALVSYPMLVMEPSHV